MRQLEMPFDNGARKVDEIETTIGDQQVKAVGWVIPHSLTDEINDKNRESWRGLIEMGLKAFERRFDFDLPAKVVIHSDPVPEKWMGLFPTITFIFFKGLTRGNYIICNDPDEFFGREDEEPSV